ncbi:MAG: hypothetical protein ACI4IL_03160 [Eubacterium sp.]
MTVMKNKAPIIIISVIAVIFCLTLTACKNNDSLNNDNGNKSLFNTITELHTQNESPINEGTGFEEDETIEYSNKNKQKEASNKKPSEASENNKTNMSNSASKQSTIVSKEGTTASKESSNTTNSNSQSATDENDGDTTEKVTTTSPSTTLHNKSTEQNGEWGTPVKN